MVKFTTVWWQIYEDDKVAKRNLGRRRGGGSEFGEQEAFERFIGVVGPKEGRRPFLIHALKLPCLLSGEQCGFAK